jgi:hypothetical protein
VLKEVLLLEHHAIEPEVEVKVKLHTFLVLALDGNGIKGS